MSNIVIRWKKDVDWPQHVNAILKYFQGRSYLKYGPERGGNALEFISNLCELGVARQNELMTEHGLSADGVATILSNVTMAIQDNGNVWSPEDGGWYVTISRPHAYIVCPKFAEAWLSNQ